MEVITIVDSSDDEDDSEDVAKSSTTRNARSVVINTRSLDETNNDDRSRSSTSSSDDSIWKIKGLSITADKSSDAAKNIDDATFVGLFKGSCLITPTEAAASSSSTQVVSQSRRYNPFKDDASSSSDSLVEFGNATFDEEVSSVNLTPSHSSSPLISCRNAEEGNDCLVTTTAVIQSTFDDDSSSVSSEDSIWNKVGLRLPPSKSNNRNDGVATNLPVNLSLSKTTAPVSITCHESRPCHDITNNDCEDTEDDTVTKLPHDDFPLLPAVDGTWRVILLMDHREFGCANNFLTSVEKKMNKHFGNKKYCEITTLPSADYLFVARLLSNTTGEVIDERVLDMIIERKSVQDVCSCLITNSKSKCVGL
jgi:hypothetical protein